MPDEEPEVIVGYPQDEMEPIGTDEEGLPVVENPPWLDLGGDE